MRCYSFERVCTVYFVVCMLFLYDFHCRISLALCNVNKRNNAFLLLLWIYMKKIDAMNMSMSMNMVMAELRRPLKKSTKKNKYFFVICWPSLSLSLSILPFSFFFSLLLALPFIFIIIISTIKSNKAYSNHNIVITSFKYRE